MSINNYVYNQIKEEKAGRKGRTDQKDTFIYIRWSTHPKSNNLVEDIEAMKREKEKALRDGQWVSNRWGLFIQIKKSIGCPNRVVVPETSPGKSEGIRQYEIFQYIGVSEAL